MFYIPKWKEFFIWCCCLLAIYFALPSMFIGSSSNLLNYLPKNTVNLGLDLRGGVSLLLEADLDNYRKEVLQQAFSQLKVQFKKDTTHSVEFELLPDLQGINLKLRKEISKDLHEQLLKKVKETVGQNFRVRTETNIISVKLDSDMLQAAEGKIMEQSIEIIRRRIDEKGAKEIDLQKQGENQILLQVPGASSPEQIKRLLGRTAKLSFHLVDLEITKKFLESRVRPPIGFKILLFSAGNSESNQRYLAVESESMLSGDMLIDAQVVVNTSKPAVSFKLSSVGSRIFADISSKNTGKMLAIVLDNEVISAPVINEPIIGGSGVISGSFSMETANELALMLRSGALATPLNIIEERVVGPNLGSDSIEAGARAMIAGAIVVIIFMVAFYGIFGLIADIAMIMNIFFIFAMLSFLDATLTLPGLAGIVLTLGMAVDSNVLICERIKEELRLGKKMLPAISSGYKAAFFTIVDSNVTTVIAGLALYCFGSGPIKGFAVTLIIGIASSMFTAVLLSKVLLLNWYRVFKLKCLKLI